jgi:hypothetical protein
MELRGVAFLVEICCTSANRLYRFETDSKSI